MALRKTPFPEVSMSWFFANLQCSVLSINTKTSGRELPHVRLARAHMIGNPHLEPQSYPGESAQ
jgi:hypothetical protein